MILTDVLDLQEMAWKDTTDNKEKTKTAVELKSFHESANRLSRYASHEENQVLTKISNKIKNQFNQTRIDLLLQNSTLPPSLINSDSNADDISRIAQTPKVKLGYLRELADRLGFILVPFNYLDPRSYDQEDYNLRSAIGNFQKKLEPWFNIYILSPIHFYDVQKHVAADVDLPIYANKDAAQAFMAINMMLPMFRTLSMNIEQLCEKSREMGVFVNRTAQELKNLINRVAALEAQVEKQRQQTIIEEQRNRELQLRLEELRSQRQFWSYEPLMFAFPKQQTINDEGTAFVGPCWGPDFKDIVFTALGLTARPDQRKNLAGKALEWSSGHPTRTGGWMPSDSNYFFAK